MNVGPDAARYWAAAGGTRVSRPFHARWLLPRICGRNLERWWAAWFAGWVLLAGGMLGWRFAAGDDWPHAVAATVMLAALPGILGPQVTIPVGVDLPATGVALCGVALCELGWWPAGLAVLAVGACIRETVPVFAAVWLWSLWPLVTLFPVVLAYLLVRQGPDPLGERFQRIVDHPFVTALEAHRGRWRDGWLMVAPWGLCLLALVDPSWPLVVALAVAYGQLLVATDTVRLVQHAAGPVMAVAAVQVVPVGWLLLVVAVHVVWWRTPERV